MSVLLDGIRNTIRHNCNTFSKESLRVSIEGRVYLPLSMLIIRRYGMNIIKKYWFMAGLTAVLLFTLADPTEVVPFAGEWLKSHGGAESVIWVMFFISGLSLDLYQVREGILDYRGTLLALTLIFVISPFVAWFFSFMPIPMDIAVGLILVAVVPTTLTSGVVMTGSSGGNMAHALLITILANSLVVITLPVTLPLLLNLSGEPVVIDGAAIMFKMARLVMFPLFLGMILKKWSEPIISRMPFRLSVISQILIWCLVWMALSGSREALMGNIRYIGLVIVLSFVYHSVILVMAFLLIKSFAIPRGRRESIIFMGGQKTLTLAILLQVSLFPELGMALAFCVIYHFVHLMMDGYLVGYLSTVPEKADTRKRQANELQ